MSYAGRVDTRVLRPTTSYEQNCQIQGDGLLQPVQQKSARMCIAASIEHRISKVFISFPNWDYSGHS